MKTNHKKNLQYSSNKLVASYNTKKINRSKTSEWDLKTSFGIGLDSSCGCRCRA